MSDMKRAARHRCNDNRALSQEKAAPGRCNTIITDYERGSLVFGIIFAVTFGLMMVHWAVM